MLPPVIFHLIRRCSYQHTGFVLLETAPDPDVMREHRRAEVFWGRLIALRVGGRGYCYIYIKLQPRPTTTKQAQPVKCRINMLSFFSYITSQISVPNQTLSLGFCPLDGPISNAPFLSLLGQMLVVDLLLWGCLNENTPTLLLSEYFGLSEDIVSSFFLRVLFLCSLNSCPLLVYILSSLCLFQFPQNLHLKK